MKISLKFVICIKLSISSFRLEERYGFIAKRSAIWRLFFAFDGAFSIEKIGAIFEKSIPKFKSFEIDSVGESELIVVVETLLFVLFAVLFDEKMSSGGGLVIFSLDVNFDKIPLNFETVSGFDKIAEIISVGFGAEPVFSSFSFIAFCLQTVIKVMLFAHRLQRLEMFVFWLNHPC